MDNATKTIPQILRENICTVFNLLNLMIAVALAAVGAWKNILFFFVILLNTVIGIVQEVRAKRQIERLTLIAMIVISDKLRKNAVQTIRYFYEQGVDVKIISGDNPAAAAAVAKLSGVKDADRLLDASGLSDAAKQTAQLVLLDSDFAVLRDVISEGRRVINNLTKSAGVFFIKTIYSVLLSILCLLLNMDFPFIPIQITLIDAVIEAFPAFFMSFERNDRKVEGTFLGSAMRAALPNSLAIIFCCIAVFLAAPQFGIDHAQMNLILYLTVGIVSLAGVVRASLPFNPLRGFLSVSSVFGFFCAVLLFAPLLQLPHLAMNSAVLLLAVAIVGILLAVFLRLPASKKAPLKAPMFAEK